MSELNKTYKIGYCMAAVGFGDLRQYNWLKKLSESCERFILAIPDDDIMMKLYAKDSPYGEPRKITDLLAYWNDVKWIDQLVTVTESELSYRAAYEKYGFDICYYGSYYGNNFIQDRLFLEKCGVAFSSAIPESIRGINVGNAIKLFLKKNKVYKIVLFGTGIYFNYYMDNYGQEFIPAYAVDNNTEKWGIEKSGILIENPKKLKEEKDAIVIICAKEHKIIGEQLRSYGILNYRSLLYQNDIALLEDFDIFLSEQESTWQTLNKVQEINYNMLEIFDDICRKHGIEYCLNYGSLIGTLRHKGFIPWDNDVDTIMTRQNCDRLKKYIDEFPKSDYYWLTPFTLGKKKYFDCVYRIGYKHAYARMEQDYCDYYENLYNGIHLDIFLIDKTYDDWRGRLQRKALAILYGLMNAYRHPKFFADYPPDLQKKNKILCAVGKYIPLRWMQHKAEKIARKFSNREDAPYYFISNDSLRMLSILFPAEDFEHVVDTPFGKVTSMIYNGADHICRMNFGDYMQLPPEEARVPHMGRVMMKADDFVFLEPKRKYMDYSID